MANLDDELDDLLADTPAEADLASEDDTATAAASDNGGGLDLDDLLAESMQMQARAKQHRADLKAMRVRNNGLDEAERKQAMARILEWEVTRVWATTTRIERYDVHTCKQCLRQQTVFNGEWLEQEHKKLRCKRLVRLPDIHDLQALSDMMQFTLDKLPVRRMDVPVDVQRCAACSPARAGDFKPAIKF